MGESYSAAISRNAPRNGSDLLRARLANGERQNERLADWIRDYSQLQSKHAADLERFLGLHIVRETDLGTLAEPWQKVVYLVVEQARLANEAARRFQIEAERPLREARHAGELPHDEVLSTGKIDRIQKQDEIRLAGLKTALARFTTIEVDKALATTKAGEQAMQAWLSFDPRDEISSYVAQIVSGVAPTATAKTGSSMSPNKSKSGGRAPLTSTNTGSTYDSSSRHASHVSNSTVKRRSSILGGLSSSSRKEEPKSGAGRLRSKVGSIFGRKKKNVEPEPIYERDSGDTLTRPPNFGPHHSVGSRNSSQASLRQHRRREEDDLYASNPRATKPSYINTGNSAEISYGSTQVNSTFDTSTTQGKSVQSDSVQGNSVQGNSTAGFDTMGTGPITPLTPTKRTDSPLRQQASGQTGGLTQETSQFLQGSHPGSHISMPGSIPTVPLVGLDVPAPPPARHSIYRQASTASAASTTAGIPSPQRSASTTSRVRPSSGQFSSTGYGAGVGHSAGASYSSSSGADAANMGPDSVAHVEAEQGDGLARLPQIPDTPNHLNGNAPGSPEQFFTPAQRFVPQFEHGNASVASISSTRAANYLPLPSGPGLVASVVEHVSAEYVGDQLVASSVRGEAMAQVHGSGDASVVLGILLTDDQAQVTPSLALKQTSSLSFEVPRGTYSAPHELVQYHSNSALGRVPILLTPTWRFDPKTVRLVLSFQLSELLVGQVDSVEVHDLVIAVTLPPSGRCAISAQSKPVATFSREKQRVTWRFNQPQVLTRGQPATKLLCQFVTDRSVTEPGTIELKARIPNVNNSLLQLRTLEGGQWVTVPTAVASDVHEQTK